VRYLLSCDYPHLPAPPPPPPPSLSLLLLPQSTTVMACRWGPHHANANATHYDDAHPPPCCPSIPVILVTTLVLPLFLELFDCCAVLSTSVIVVAASSPIEVRGILCVELLHESQNALPDVDEYPSTFDASCAVMLAPISSSREGEYGTRFQANTSTSSSSSSSRRTYLRCAPRAASTIWTRRLLPPRQISRTRRSRVSRICTTSSPRRLPRTRHPSHPTLP